MRQKIIPVLIVLAGFLLLSYPFMSNYLFERSAGSMVRSYGKKTAGMNQEMKEKALDEARRYNEELLSSSIQLTDPFKAKKTDGETLFIKFYHLIDMIPFKILVAVRNISYLCFYFWILENFFSTDQNLSLILFINSC